MSNTTACPLQRSSIDNWEGGWDGQWNSLPSGMDVVYGEFVLVTAEEADRSRYQPISALLRRVRNAFGLDSVLVTQYTEGHPLVRYAFPQGPADEPSADPIEAEYGRQVVLSRSTQPRPANVPTDRTPEFIALPVISRSGVQHGTLCCLSWDMCASGHTSLDALRSVARLLAASLDYTEPGPSEFGSLVELPATERESELVTG